ncbi:hypothetical protein [Methylobacterium tarhaniae]|uniref:hypothetical protein n=1 Tax=Methylobacterium tarhaniae TaxID=1187852 RepID=UPI003D0314D8
MSVQPDNNVNQTHVDMKFYQYATVDDLRIHNGRNLYSISDEKFPIHFFAKFSNTNLPLIVFGQGMVDRSKISIPRFQRMDWADSFPENVVILNDPTLFLAADIGLGWLLGSADNYVLPRIAEVVERIRLQLKIENRNILFYGTSAGGFSSLMLSTHFENSSVLVNNPQTDVLKFKRGGVGRLLQAAFGGISVFEAEKKYGERFSYIEALRRGAKLPRIYYLQNILDHDHYNDQLLPLMKAATVPAKAKGGTHPERQFIVDLYVDDKTLHNPLGLSRVRYCMDVVRPWFNNEV